MEITKTEYYTGLKTLADVYLIQLKTEGKSPNTIRIYNTALTVFNQFLSLKQYSNNVNEITAPKFREFIAHLQNVPAFMQHPFTCPQKKKLAGHTINCYLRALRAFWTWLEVEEYIDVNPFWKIVVPKAPKKVIQPFDDDQIRELLKAIDVKTVAGARDWAVILTLLDTGIRVSELTNLKLEDINISQRAMRVTGKGNKERIVPIGISVQKALLKYLTKFRPKQAHPNFTNIFLNRDGMPLTPNRVQTIIETYSKKVGIKGVRASPHTFRHTFAVSYLRNGGDMFTLQRILGHESLDMVRNYVNVTQYDLQRAHLLHSPADNIRFHLQDKR